MWDEFVDSSKNGTFLFKRDYMEYHSDRFQDMSLIYYDDKGDICGLFPASVSDKIVNSHGGLTYGGLVLGRGSHGYESLQMFELLKTCLRDRGIRVLIYKPVPHIYHALPAEEDLYALFRNGATLKVRNLATVIDLNTNIKSSRLIKRAAKCSLRWGISVHEVDAVDSFWEIIVNDRWERHKVHPVHRAGELNYLKSKFPDNIRFFVAKDMTDTVLGCAVIYLDRGVIHLQYAAATPEGKQKYATDIIYHAVIFDRLTGNRYFDFGTSNDDGGYYLNEGMVRHKEEFGGRAVIYDTYELCLNN